MKKRRIKATCRVATFLLAVLFVLLSVPVAASAENEDPLLTDAVLEQPFSPLEEGDLPFAQLQALKVEDVALPETVTLAEAQEKEHVNRLYAQEQNLHTAVFQNRSGTKTAYVFDKPIKYVTQTGETRDKSTRITSTKLSGYAYAMTDNSFQAYFGPTTAKGITVNYGDDSLSMLPEPSTLVSTATLSEDERSVIYNGAFGANTALRYTTQLSGVKEDVVLLSNVGKTTFRFLLTTKGLTPVQLDHGAWVLVNENHETVMNFGSILINDSAGHLALGAMTIVPRTAGGYVMTVEVPAEFLRASTTVYPVYIDPTVTVNEGSSSYPRIEDFGIYIDGDSLESAEEDTTQHIFNYDKSSVIYKFYDFIDDSGAYHNYDEYKIGKVTLKVRSYSDFSARIIAEPIGIECTAAPAQSYILPDGEELFDYIVSLNDSEALIDCTYDNHFQIDITEIVKGWARYNKGLSNNSYENPTNGFVLTQCESEDVYIASVEASGTTNVQYIIDYSLYSGAYMFKNKSTAMYVNAIYPETENTSPATLSISQASVRDYQGSFVVKYIRDGKHLIMPMYDLSYALCWGISFTGKVAFASIPSTITNDAFYWEIESSSTGVIFRNCYTGTVLYSSSTGLSMIRESDAAVPAATIWHTVRSYGNKQFRRIPDSDLDSIDCQFYALFDDNVSLLDGIETSFLVEYNISRGGFPESDLEQVKKWFAEYAHREFCYLLSRHGFNYDNEDSFTKNGESAVLTFNQYRVVLRTGFHLTGAVDSPYSIDYHFWYQTVDGRWAHKNGDTKPVLLPWGVTPDSFDGGGWALNGNNAFYDGDVYSYIITTS